MGTDGRRDGTWAVEGEALSPRGRRAVEIAQALIRCPSVTPHEAGALDVMQSLLQRAGFRCHRLPFSDAGTPDVDNLFARLGDRGPHLCFAGHIDVVPPGDAALWTHPPFAGVIADGHLWGRGACDMKGAIACFASAALGFAAEREGAVPGSISVLITGDEEGPSVNGTAKVLRWMAANGHVPDHCLVGEPSNADALGEAIKIGRRGSLSARLTVIGRQGHSAYPHLANNPVPGLIEVLNRCLAEPLDAGSEHFEPSYAVVTGIDTGNPAFNVIPERISAQINIRFNDRHDAESLRGWLQRQAAAALQGTGLRHEIAFEPASPCFLTRAPDLIAVMADAVEAHAGRRPDLSTGGGTSDARFVKDYCPVIEFGLVNRTIHQVDERVSLADMDMLTAIYGGFIERYFARFAPS